MDHSRQNDPTLPPPPSAPAGIYNRRPKGQSATLWIAFCGAAIAIVAGLFFLAQMPANQQASLRTPNREHSLGAASPSRPSAQPVKAPELDRATVKPALIERDPFLPLPTTAASDNEWDFEDTAPNVELEDQFIDDPPPAPILGDPNAAARAFPIADEILDTLIAQIRTSPSVAIRRNAAKSLGRRGDNPDKVVPVLLDACRKDPSPQVRVACLEAFGSLEDLGANQATVLSLLRDVVYQAESIENKRIAADSLMMAAPNSAEARQVLRTALVGGKGTSPIASSLAEDGSTIRDWRHWAYEKLKSPNVNSDWSIPLLIKICEAEIDEISNTYIDYDVQRHLEATSSVLAQIGNGMPAVHAHLKKYVNSVFPEMENATQLRVHYDSLLKRIEAINAEAK